MANTKVQSEQIEDGSITADKLADGTIVAAELADNAVTTAKINADAVTGAKIADDAIDSEHYTDGSIDTAHIADAQITVAKMAVNSVDSDQYVDGSIDTVHLGDLQVTTAKIANGNISTAKIADNAVTSAKLDTNIDIAGTLDVTGATTLDGNLSLGGVDGDNAVLSLTANTGNWVFTNVQSNRNLEISDSDGTGTVFTINTSGNVGIGTNTSPSALLHLANAGPSIKLEDTDNDSDYEIKNGNGTFRIIDTTNSTDRLNILSSGNVGIGTTNPTAPLHVTRTASGYPILKLTQNGADQYNTIYLQNSNSTAATVVMGTGGSSVGNTSWANSAVFGTTSDAKVVLLQNDSAAVTIDTDQNVGINTVSPAAKLHVKSAGASSEKAFHITESNNNDIFTVQGGGRVTVRYYPLVIGNDSGHSVTSGARLFIDGTTYDTIFDSVGRLLIGTTGVYSDSNDAMVVSGGRSNFTASGISSGAFNRQTNTGEIVAFLYNGSGKGSISTDGSNIAYNTSSDTRLKNILGESKGLDIVNQLNPVNFAWKESGKTQDGLIAQEVEPLIPEAVNINEQTGYYEMDYSKIVTPLVKAIQEQQEQIEQLKSEIEALKS